MKSLNYYAATLSIAVLACGSVEVNSDTKTDTSTAFGQYIALGSGFTAGFTQGGLFRDGQSNSFPNLLAKQLKQVGAADFKQPLFEANQANGTGFLNAKSINPLVTEKSNGTAIRGTSPLLFTKFSGINHNLGVPHMKMNDVGKPGFGNSKNTFFNPFYERLLADNQQDVSYLNYVKAAKFDFFTCEFGLNDVLDYAQAGGTKIMTPIETFAISCRQIFEVLGEKKVKGLVLNIPNIEQMPHFVKVSSLKTTVYITSAGSVRKATDQEIVMLPVVEQMAKNGNQYGRTEANPLKNEDVLDATELNRLRQNITDLNTVLNVEAKRQNLTVLDINALLTNISNGSFSEKGVAVKGDISNSGFYSVDGVYPTQKGAAILANEIIKSLNVEMKANKQKEITTLDLSTLKGVEVK